MPSHPDRIRKNYICPFCHEYMMDGKHTNISLTLLNNQAHMVGCPKHPMSNPTITMIPRKLKNESTY